MMRAGASGSVSLTPRGLSANGIIRLRLELKVFSKLNGKGKLLSKLVKESDITVFQLSQFIQASYLAVNASSIKATDATTQAVTGAITSGTPQISFGTGTTAAAYTDFAIQTAAGGTNPVTASSTAATSGANTWTVTATWSNTTGGTVTISELALYVTTTAGVATNKTYALTHDQFAGTSVSNGGSAAATLTFTMS